MAYSLVNMDAAPREALTLSTIPFLGIAPSSAAEISLGHVPRPILR